jgi:hypothetical protein
MFMETEKPKRRQRWDAGLVSFTERDIAVLTWIGQQYAIRLDHLQQLLGRYAGSLEPLSVGATRKVVRRWHNAGWVEMQRLRGADPLWVWPTRLALRSVGLPYASRNMEQSLDDLKHLYAINEVRLSYCDEVRIRWVSERSLLQEVVRVSGKDLLHRPDAERYWTDGTVTAIEVELSLKKPTDLSENLMELVRGEEYLRLKTEHGAASAQVMSRGMKSTYTDIWYFGPPEVRRQVRRERARLLERGALSEEEAERIFVKWYPLARSDEEKEQENEEENEALDLG